MEVLFVGNDHLIKLTGLQNSETLAYINGATVEAHILTSDDEEDVSGAITMSYVAASDGDYTGLIEDTVVLVDGDYYIVEVTATASSDVAFWRFKRAAEYRQS